MTQSAGYDFTLVSQLADVSLVSATLDLLQVSRPQEFLSGASFLGIEELQYKGSNTGKRRTEQNVTLICYCFLKKYNDVNPLKSVVI